METCWACGGSGEVECPDCDLGEEANGDTCSTCLGDYEGVLCDDCEGDGFTGDDLDEDDWRKPR